MKQQFLPSADYQLRHGTKKILDTSLSVRYSGLTNNTKLELVRCEQSRAESLVTIGLQTEQGDRLLADFKPVTSLWAMLQHYEQHQKLNLNVPNLHPVCIYMRDEIISEAALQYTTFRSLGLTAGKATIRFLHRAVDDATLSAITEKNEAEKRKEEKLLAKSQKVTEKMALSGELDRSEATVSSATSMKEMNAAEPSSKMDTISETPSQTATTRVTPQQTERVQCSNTKPESATRVQAVEATQADLQMIASMSSRAMVLKSFQGPPVQRDILQEPPTQEAHISITPPAPYVPFKFPEETKGMDLYRNELSEVKMDDFKPCDRRTVLFIQADKIRKGSDIEVDDDIFTITEADLVSRMQSLKQQVKALDDVALSTAAMREVELESRMSKYSRCVVRLHFTNKHILQAVFRPKETVHALKQFVKQQLKDNDIPFNLYTTPPKEVLRHRDSTLYQAGLVPLAHVYFACDVQQDSYLSEEVLESLTTQQCADDIVNEIMSAGENVVVKVDGASGSVERRNAAPNKDAPPKKVPKWFKVGK